ncbi:MAG: 2-C-methyl-D-erythritol 2,4-cyclodiphosphate synthase [Synergistaceae bacterium]|nr:2-C-methyl-D-erythritol 2,4-cyclodiphosphate synthase [Synergistaceae bacterium]
MEEYTLNMKRETWSFIIAAGGTGTRLGGIPKQFRLLNGRPVWKWSAQTAEELWKDGVIEELVIVVPEDHIAEVEKYCDFKIPTHIIDAGVTRSQSVMNGLKNSCGSHVLVHDAARPFITKEFCLDLIKNASVCGASIPLIESTDSLKKVTAGRMISADRKEYFRAQTPQAFEKASLINAINSFGFEGTDEAAAWTASERNILCAKGLETNFKITTKFDWDVASLITGGNKIQRTGHGFDIHQLVKGRKLILAGVEIENSEFGLLGHSDADIILHTVMDAILGAAGQPDIGTIFPASDPKWKNADSSELLKTVICKVRSDGWNIDWVDVTLQAQAPKLGHMVPVFISNVTSIIAENQNEINFNIKVKSGENCGSVGRSECMICHGVATLSKYDWN